MQLQTEKDPKGLGNNSGNYKQNIIYHQESKITQKEKVKNLLWLLGPDPPIIGTTDLFLNRNTAWIVSKYEVFSGPYFPNTGKYGPEKTPYLGTFYAVENIGYITNRYCSFLNERTERMP